MTVGSLDFSFGGFCCFSCVASHQFLADLGIWCHSTGSPYKCNVKPNGRAASIDNASEPRGVACVDVLTVRVSVADTAQNSLRDDAR